VKPTRIRILSSSEPKRHDEDYEDTQERPVVRPSRTTKTLEHEPTHQPDQLDTTHTPDDIADTPICIDQLDATHILDDIADTSTDIDQLDTAPIPGTTMPVDILDTVKIPGMPALIDTLDTTKIATRPAPPLIPIPNHATTRPSTIQRKQRITPIEFVPTLKTHSINQSDTYKKVSLSRGTTMLLIALLSILVFQTLTIGPTQFLGAQGWAYVLGGSSTTNNADLLKNISQQLHHKPPSGTPQPQLTPQQYIALITNRMTLDQKLGQMMLVQFTGPTYSADLNTMITQENVGAVLLFSANGNVESKPQLINLVQQMQHNSPLPLTIAIDQEGGTVDRLAALDGPRPAAATIGATNDPAQAMAAGVQDAQDLASYGINLNLAPVVDVTNVYNPQLYDRTFGDNPTIVTQMASAYLQGLQQSGKVVGALKHFPGLGDVGVDPHVGVPYLTRSLPLLEQIDWAPYRTLIQQGHVYAIMVTHEIVTAVDSTLPSSLSHKLITGILRQQLGFQGVIMTDSLTMEGITAYYSEAQAAALAIEAGDDLLMGASSAADVATMIEGIKQAMAAGSISQQQIDASVERILMLKYMMGLLPIPTN
jgi:beta-N-acetylhexosaminidase